MPCAIYDTRPQWCRLFPQPATIKPTRCTVAYEGRQQVRGCEPEECGQACCATPRGVGGDNGAAYPGGPCRHLTPLGA